MKRNFIFMVLLYTALAQPNARGANQYISSIDSPLEIENGVDLQKYASQIIKQATHDAGIIYNLGLFEDKPTSFYLVAHGGNVQRKAIIIQFKSRDSALIFKEMLESKESYHFLYLPGPANENIEIGDHWMIIQASSLYVLNKGQNTIMKLGELIGPRRQIENQKWLDRMLIYIFGHDRLNDVNFPTSVEGIPQQDI